MQQAAAMVTIAYWDATDPTQYGRALHGRIIDGCIYAHLKGLSKTVGTPVALYTGVSSEASFSVMGPFSVSSPMREEPPGPPYKDHVTSCKCHELQLLRFRIKTQLKPY